MKLPFEARDRKSKVVEREMKAKILIVLISCILNNAWGQVTGVAPAGESSRESPDISPLLMGAHGEESSGTSRGGGSSSSLEKRSAAGKVAKEFGKHAAVGIILDKGKELAEVAIKPVGDFVTDARKLYNSRQPYPHGFH